MQIGNYKIYSIETGHLGLDGGAMYGVVPKVFWEKTNPPDAKNRITLTTRHLVLVSDSKKILVDTGSGKDWNEKFSKIYRIDHTTHDLFPALESIGLKPDEITDVILTHLHFDHTGGSVILDNDKFVPAFPNATYHLQKKQYEWGLDPSKKDGASFIKDRFVPLYDEGILKLYDEETEYDDYIKFILVNGHTFSQQLVKVSDGSETLLYCADLIPLYTHINLPYIMSYDLQPLKTLEEKSRILRQAVEENWKLFFEHDPELAAITVDKTDRGFAVKERFDTI